MIRDTTGWEILSPEQVTESRVIEVAAEIANQDVGPLNDRDLIVWGIVLDLTEERLKVLIDDQAEGVLDAFKAEVYNYLGI